MAIGDFRPTLGKLELNTSSSILTGNNAAFCAKLLEGREQGPQANLESLTYVLPVQVQEGEGQSERPSVVVNLLMQLRASCDQNNFFLRTNQAAQAQVTARLHQVLSQCSGAARAQAGEIERAIRTRLVQEEELSRALKRLEREVKKNSVSLSWLRAEGEPGFWSGSPSRQKKDWTARAERPEDFLRIQMHRSETLRSIGMRQEERVSHETRLAYLQRENGVIVPELPHGQEGREKQEKERARSAKRRRKDRKSTTTKTERTVQAVQATETRRETRIVEAPETERIVQIAWAWETHRETQSVHIPEIERTVRTVEAQKAGQVFETVQSLGFHQKLRMAGGPGPRWDVLPLQIWWQVVRRAFAPFNWPLIRNLPGAQSMLVGETRAVLRSNPVFHVGELPSERPAFGRKIRIHSHGVTALVWRSPGLSGEETALDRLSPEVRLLPQVTAAGLLLDQDSVIQTPGEGVLSVWRQALRRNDLEIYRRVLEQLPGALFRWEGLRSVTDRFRQTASRRVPERVLQTVSVFREVPGELRSVLEPSRPAAAGDSRTFWRKVLGRAYTAVNREIFRDTSIVRTVPAGGSEAITYLDREGPVREYTAEGHTPKIYSTEGYALEYIAPDGLPPEVRLLSQPAAAERAIYRVKGPARGDLTLYRQLVKRSFQEVRKQLAERVSPEIYRQVIERSTPELVGYKAFRNVLGDYRQTALPNVPEISPVLRKKQLPGRTITSVRETRAESGGISSLDREGPVREFTAEGHIPKAYSTEEYTLEEYTAPEGLPPEVRLLSQPTAAERAIYRVKGPAQGGLTLYRQLVKRSLQEIWNQLIERMSPEIYRQVIKRSAPEVFKRTVGETPPEFVGRKVFPNAPEIFWPMLPMLLKSSPSASGTKISRQLRLAERRRVLVQRDTDTFVRGTWTRNHILYRLFRQKHGTEPETKETALLPEGERPHGKRSVPERSGHSSRRPEVEKAQGERDGETYVQSVLTPERTEGNPVIVYRSPARPVSPAGAPASAPAVPGQVEGEDVFQAQTVSPDQARALGQAFSYEMPGSRREERGQLPADGVPPLRAEESINYNRLTEEILVRLERRLRAERRKFGL